MRSKNIFKLAVCAMLMVPVQTFSQTLAKANKSDGYVNPILPYNLCADPTAVEYNGRLYIYGTNDQLEYNTTKNGDNNTYGKITQLVCMSSADLVNWTYHGTIDVKSLSPWIATSWAPSIVSRVEKDGKTHFYLYYTNSASGIGVLTSTSPTGPWKDPIGRALINWNTPGRGNQSNIIDPGVCIDDEGNGWLTFGGGDPNSTGSKLMPGNARIVKLGKNMTSLDGDIMEIPAPFHFEANELNYINGQFVFSYSGGWSCNSGDWSKYLGKGSYACPGNCSILMMTTDDPVNGKWKYAGEMLKNPGSFNYPWGNNHSHLQKFGDKYYMTYHTQALAKTMGLNGGYRGIAIDAVTVKESTCKISQAKMTNAGPTAISENRLVGTDQIEAETMANCAGINVLKSGSAFYVGNVHAGDWTMVRSITFPEGAKSVSARLKGTGTLEIRPNKNNASPIATIDFKGSTLRNYSVDLSEVIPEGKTYTYLYFVFTSASGTVYFDRYQFSTQTVDEQTPIEVVETDEVEELSTIFYNADGVQLSGRPSKGFYIEKTTMSDGSQKIKKHVK